MPTEPIAAVAEAPPSAAEAAVSSPAVSALEYSSPLAPPRASGFRWVVLALVFFAITINYIDRMVISILAPDLKEQFHIDNRAYGYITAAFGLSYALGQMISGRWLDWVGVRIGYAIALTAWSAASMLHALSRSAMGFGIFRGVLGVTESPAYPAAVKTLAEWFPKKERALAMGVANAGANVGAVLAPAMIPWLALTYGWRWAFIASGAVGLIWLVFWIPLYHRPNDPPPRGRIIAYLAGLLVAVVATASFILSTYRFIAGLSKGTWSVMGLSLPFLSLAFLVAWCWLALLVRKGVSRQEVDYIQSDPADRASAPLRLKPLAPQQKTLAASVAGGVVFALVVVLIAMPLGFTAKGLLLGCTFAIPVGGFTAYFFTRSGARLFFHRQSWGFIAGKFLTDPIWSFYLFWLPTFLKDKYGVNLAGVAAPLVVIYLMADVGSIAGGWMSSSMIKRGFSVNAARKLTLLVCALSVVPAAFVTIIPNMWGAVLIVGLALAAHQGFSSNLYTLVSDTFPKRAVASVAGAGGTFGYIGYTLFGILTGWILDLTNKNYLPVFIMCGSAYLVAFAIIHFAMPRMEPAVIEEV